MKIGQVSHAYPPHVGGIENYVYRLKNSLTEKGNLVNVYTTDMGLTNGDILDSNVNYCSVDLSILRNPISIELARKLYKSKDEIFHLHGYEFFSTLQATQILKDKPKVLTQHGTLKIKNNFISFLLNNPYHPVLQYILENMDKIIVLGEKDKRFLLNSFDISTQNIAVIPNGIYIEKFSPISENNVEFINKYHLKENSFKILFVGRLVEQKGAHILVNAVINHIHNDNIEVLIIGTGEPNYLARLTNIEDKRIHFLGKMNFGKDLIAAYNICDLFVILSQFEGLPTVMLEAMACGLPILTTSVGNIPQVIKEGENGFFLDSPVDEKELAIMVEYLIESDNEHIKINNYNLIKNKFNWNLISNSIFDIYRKILNNY